MAPSPQVVSAKAKEHWPTYISNMKPKDVHGVWGVGKFRAMHGDGKSSADGVFKGWLMKGSDGKWHVKILETKRDIKVTERAFDTEPTFADIAAWLKSINL